MSDVSYPHLPGGSPTTLGTLEVFTQLDGNTATRIVGQGYMERMISCVFNFNTSAVVAARQVQIVYVDQDSNRFARVVAPSTQTASLTNTYNCVVGVTAQAVVGTHQEIPLPPLVLTAGWKIQWNCANLDGGDTFTTIRGLIERFPVGREGYSLGPVRPRRRPTPGLT